MNMTLDEAIDRLQPSYGEDCDGNLYPWIDWVHGCMDNLNDQRDEWTEDHLGDLVAARIIAETHCPELVPAVREFICEMVRDLNQDLLDEMAILRHLDEIISTLMCKVTG